MTPYTIREEPITREGVNAVLDRQDEPLTKAKTYRLLQKDILAHLERLFEMKSQYNSMRILGGRIKLGIPYKYRCATCGNKECLNYGFWNSGAKEGTIIANQTSMNGCLEWLPGVR
jgi:predicted Zn-ribbon and HTH transcriptional regulator